MIKVEKLVTGTNSLTLEVAKLWMKVDGSDEDTLITSLIDEARQLIETYVNMSMVATTITATASPRVELCLPYPPIVSIVSVKDTDGEDVTYEYTGFCLDFEPQEFSVTSPTTNYVETVTTYEAGTDVIDSGLLLAWKQVVLYLYENRGDGKIMQMIASNQNINQFRTKVWI